MSLQQQRLELTPRLRTVRRQLTLLDPASHLISSALDETSLRQADRDACHSMAAGYAC